MFKHALCFSLIVIIAGSGSAQPSKHGMALTIGLNAVDPGHYAGWDGLLKACEYDAQDMAQIAQARGFDTKTLLTKAATRKSVLDEINRSAGALKTGDIFLLTYSGHGGQVPDRNGDELDGEDETWCLYDGEVLDDELAAMWTRFAPGVRICVVSDSCHSGTVTKMFEFARVEELAIQGVTDSQLRSRFEAFFEPRPSAKQEPSLAPVRAMPERVAREVYRANMAMYDKLGDETPSEKKSRADTKATIVLLAACQDNQLSADGTFNGRFTGVLKRVWNNGRFSGSYLEFQQEMLAQMPSHQSPGYYVTGAANPAFEAEVPFTI